MRSMKNLNAKWFLAIIVTVFLAASVATIQIHSAKAATTRNFTLHGGFLQGWGFNASGMSSPGPTIVVEQGDTVNLTLISSDGITHRFFVSYTNSSSSPSSGTESSDFSGTLNFQFVATGTVGSYTYYCAHHPGVMYGTFQVVQTGTIPEFQPLVLLSLLLVLSTAVAALVFRRKR